MGRRAGASSKGTFWRWVGANMFVSGPQAMAPIAYSLATAGIVSDLNIGAAMMSAMMTAQIIFAVPVTALARRFPIGPFIRVLMISRGVALTALTIAIVMKAHVSILLTLAACAGALTGAGYGLLRAVLNQLVVPGRLTRAVSIAATGNEIVFAAGPVLASLLGAAGAVYPVAGMVVAAIMPAILLPRLRRESVVSGDASANAVTDADIRKSIDDGSEEKAPVVQGRADRRRRSRGITPAAYLFFACAVADGSVLASIETGAIALSERFGIASTSAVVFTLSLCIASICGGLIITASGRMPTRTLVLCMLAIQTTGALVIAVTPVLWIAVAAAVAIGLCLAPLATYYNLILERLLAPERRAEGFSILRTAQGAGIVIASGVLAVADTRIAFIVAASMMGAAFLSVAAGGGRIARDSARYLI